MINWIPLESEDQLSHLVKQSESIPCIIFKHSTRCSVSSMAKYRLESDWIFTSEELKTYCLDLLRFRALSNLIADSFAVYHESPQLLLINQGECTYESSHLDITVDELKESLTDIA